MFKKDMRLLAESIVNYIEDIYDAKFSWLENGRRKCYIAESKYWPLSIWVDMEPESKDMFFLFTIFHENHDDNPLIKKYSSKYNMQFLYEKKTVEQCLALVVDHLEPVF